MTDDIARIRRVGLWMVNDMLMRNGRSGVMRFDPLFAPLNACFAELNKRATDQGDTDARRQEACTAIIAISDAAFGLRTRPA